MHTQQTQIAIATHGIHLALTRQLGGTTSIWSALAHAQHIWYMRLQENGYMCWCDRVAPPIIKETHSRHTCGFQVTYMCASVWMCMNLSGSCLKVAQLPYLWCGLVGWQVPQRARLCVAAKIKCVILNESRHV